MWHFCIGFGLGIYVGTYYDCKPSLDKVADWVKQLSPPKKK